MEKNPFGHPPDCTCEGCEDWRDVQLGLAALKGLKQAKGGKVQLHAIRCCHCSVTTTSDSKFCPKCGKRLGCENCGYAEVPREASFCPQCGHRLQKE